MNSRVPLDSNDLPPMKLEECLKAMIALKDHAPLHENADVEAVWLRQVLKEWKAYRHALSAISSAAVLDGIKYIPESAAVCQRIAQEALGLPTEPVRIYTDKRFVA
jgi:hypothetical protein